MKTKWIKGPRTVSEKMKGKNGGPHVDQTVVKVMLPKGTNA